MPPEKVEIVSNVPAWALAKPPATIPSALAVMTPELLMPPAKAEIGRVLKPDGRLVVSIPNGYGLCDGIYRFVFESLLRSLANMDIASPRGE